MIADERNQAAAASQFEQLFEHAPAVGSSVDIIAERDDRVGRARLDRLQQGGQRRGATVDVANGNRAGSRRTWLVVQSCEIPFSCGGCRPRRDRLLGH